jgi:DNA-binding response OmpR family regulator
VLGDAGYEVTEAGDGSEGIKLYREVRPDLVITDLVMPEKEGIETIVELRRDFPEVKIIAISGGNNNRSGSYLSMAEKLGAERTIGKPFKIPELLGAVRAVLDGALD